MDAMNINTITRDIQLSLGLITGHKSKVFNGENLNLPNGTQVLPWIGPQAAYVWPTTTPITHISSSSASDTGTVIVSGLNSTTWETEDLTVQLAGQTKTALPVQLIRINSMISLSNLVGNVYCYENVSVTNGIPNVTSAVKGYIEAASNVMFFSGYTVPACCFSQLNSVTVTCRTPATGTMFVRFYTRPNPLSVVWRAQTLSFSQGSTSIANLKVDGFGFPARTDIWIEALAPTVNCGVSFSAAIEEFRIA